jgi:hypothetical protein
LGFSVTVGRGTVELPEATRKEERCREGGMGGIRERGSGRERERETWRAGWKQGESERDRVGELEG